MWGMPGMVLDLSHLECPNLGIDLVLNEYLENEAEEAG